MHELKGMIYPVEALGCGPMAPAHPRFFGICDVDAIPDIGFPQLNTANAG